MRQLADEADTVTIAVEVAQSGEQLAIATIIIAHDIITVEHWVAYDQILHTVDTHIHILQALLRQIPAQTVHDIAKPVIRGHNGPHQRVLGQYHGRQIVVRAIDLLHVLELLEGQELQAVIR